MAGIREVLAAAWLRWSSEWHLLALKLTQNGADADDAVSEAMRRTIERNPSLSSERHARNYVRQVIRNVVANTYKRRRTQKALLENIGRSQPGDTPTVLDAFIAADESARIGAIVNETLAEMDDTLREAFDLYYAPEEEMTFRDVAEAQDVSVRTAYKRVQDALDLLANAIEEDLE